MNHMVYHMPPAATIGGYQAESPQRRERDLSNQNIGLPVFTGTRTLSTLLPTALPEITSARRIQWDHNFIQHSGGQPVSTTHVMKVSSNGQVSIPAEARARWKADHVVVVDLGDRVVLRPLPVDPVTDLQGKYRGRGPSSERARRQARIDEASRERRR